MSVRKSESQGENLCFRMPLLDVCLRVALRSRWERLEFGRCGSRSFDTPRIGQGFDRSDAARKHESDCSLRNAVRIAAWMSWNESLRRSDQRRRVKALAPEGRQM